MASIRKRYREPLPESFPYAVAVGMKVYSWIGSRDSKEKQLKVDVFDPVKESWRQMDTRGDCPAAVRCGTTVAVLNDVYTYGGVGNGPRSEYDGLHKLDTTTMRWSYLNPRGHFRPSPKGLAKMVVVQGNRLALFGGYTPKVVKKNKNPLKKNVTTGGTSNEFHMFHIDKSAPPPYKSVIVLILSLYYVVCLYQLLSVSNGPSYVHIMFLWIFQDLI